MGETAGRVKTWQQWISLLARQICLALCMQGDVSMAILTLSGKARMTLGKELEKRTVFDRAAVDAGPALRD
jgi:uncharacterized RmlC-like cupin family protein